MILYRFINLRTKEKDYQPNMKPATDEDCFIGL